MSISSASSTTPAKSMMRRRAGDVIAPCTALVPLTPAMARPEAPQILSRPDPSFVAHLIATAQQSPQTRVLRRAATPDVMDAYRSVANQNQPAAPTGNRMRFSA
jgi:hypothetical protein